MSFKYNYIDYNDYDNLIFKNQTIVYKQTLMSYMSTID